MSQDVQYKQESILFPGLSAAPKVSGPYASCIP